MTSDSVWVKESAHLLWEVQLQVSIPGHREAPSSIVDLLGCGPRHERVSYQTLVRLCGGVVCF